jgi:C4-dicarboxylate-specific signal transduction histidine kinase
LDRVTRELALRKRLQEALLVFSRGVSARLALDTGLEALAREVNDLFGADRTSVWLHDRRTHSLSLTGSSDARHDTSQERISTSEDSPIAHGLRQDGVQVTGSGAARLLVAPLRGWRRALGTLVIDGPPRNVNDEQLVELSTDLARQLSIAVEGVVVLDELIRQQARLLQSEKLASLGQFVAGIAHEMNNPLQSVLGHLELMIESREHTAHRADLKRIYHDADRAAKIVNNLLVFGGSRRATRKPVDIDALVAGVIAIREAALPKSGVHIVLVGDASDLRVAGDAELLQQALLNIVINAEQAIADSGRSGRVSISSVAQNGRALITVDDDGPGIAADVLPRIFDPFFTTKEVGKGTGLGLAIVYGIVQEHGGSIQASTRTEGGARFTIDLPL